MPNAGPSWGDHLSRFFNEELHAGGFYGNSNEKILRNTITDLMSLSNVTKVVVSLTFENRFDLFHNNEIVSVTPGYNSTTFSDEYKQFIKYKILTQSSILSLSNLFSNLVTLKSFVELSLNSKFFVFWGADETGLMKSFDLQNILDPYLVALKDNSFDLVNFSFCKFAYDNNYFSHETTALGVNAHPPAKAHKKIAEMIYDRLK